MYRNDIGDDGVSLVVDGLQYNNTLTKLDIGRCGLSVKGTVVYKMEFKIIRHSSSCTSSVYLVKQNHLDQTDKPYFFIEAIT